MSVKKKKSKKRYVASSKRPLSDVPLYLDRNLGKHVIADALRSSGAVVELHDDHLAPNAPDEDWIALVARNGWLAITKDKNIRYRVAELGTIRKYGAMVLVVRARNATGQELAEVLVKARTRIQRFVRKNKPPFVAGIDRSGHLSMYDL